MDPQVEGVLDHAAGGAGGVELVLGQGPAVEPGPLEQVELAVVMRDERDALAVVTVPPASVRARCSESGHGSAPRAALRSRELGRPAARPALAEPAVHVGEREGQGVPAGPPRSDSRNHESSPSIPSASARRSSARRRPRAPRAARPPRSPSTGRPTRAPSRCAAPGRRAWPGSRPPRARAPGPPRARLSRPTGPGRRGREVARQRPGLGARQPGGERGEGVAVGHPAQLGDAEGGEGRQPHPQRRRSVASCSGQRPSARVQQGGRPARPVERDLGGGGRGASQQSHGPPVLVGLRPWLPRLAPGGRQRAT